MRLALDYKKEDWIVILVTGIFLGFLSFFSPGSLFIFILSLFVLILIRQFSMEEDRRFLTLLFIWGLILRIFLVLLLQLALISARRWFVDINGFGGSSTFLFGDDAYYTLRGWGMAQHLIGKLFINAFDNYGQGFHLMPLALFQYYFGFSPISSIFINCLLGVLLVVVYYFIAKMALGIKVAKVSAILITFFPSLITWSIVNLKDPMVLFIGASVFLIFMYLIEEVKIGKILLLLFLLILMLYLQYFTRRSVFLPTFLSIVLSFIFINRNTRNVLLFIFIILLCLSLAGFDFGLATFFKKISYIFKNIVVNSHSGFINTGGFVYYLYDRPASEISPRLISYFEVIKALPIGIFHFLFEPFLWRKYSISMLMVYPQMFLWYLLIPFCVFGFLNKFMVFWKRKIVFMFFLLLGIPIFSLSSGNIGTNFRIRDVFTPVILMFAAKGILDTIDGLFKKEA